MEDNFAERVAAILTNGDLIKPHVKMLKERYRWVACVVSASFEGLNEAERQALIWDILEQNLSVEEHRRIEFVSAMSPSEERAEAA